MYVAEVGLYLAAWAFRSSSIAHTPEMKTALTNVESNDAYRAQEIARVTAAVREYGLPIAGKTVLDFGCNDGALSAGYLKSGAAHVIGVDVDESALNRARALHRDDRLRFLKSTVGSIPIRDSSVDVVVSYDVFEHVSYPPVIARELWRSLKPGGWALVGTWSWYHPFAPHLWAVMPVPWAHMVVSERTLLKACRRVYHSAWYAPDRHDFDAAGQRLPDKYTEAAISRDYLNHYLIRDFERAFRSAGFACQTEPVPFGSWYARWARPLARLAWLREFLSGYVWFVLRKPGVAAVPSVL
jgi:2-polyprenyl-3-methyl-5-hydroxy-6-metoxy-1,4-benzoquinol methylase